MERDALERMRREVEAEAARVAAQRREAQEALLSCDTAMGAARQVYAAAAQARDEAAAAEAAAAAHLRAAETPAARAALRRAAAYVVQQRRDVEVLKRALEQRLQLLEAVNVDDLESTSNSTAPTEQYHSDGR
jgi:hypothetical protein